MDIVATRVAGYNPALDGLRAFAVITVAIYHAFPTVLPGGWWGVDLFFVLSGFLITSLLMQERARFGSIDRPAFYARRIIRLWPAFFILLAFCATIALASAHRQEGLTAVAVSALYLMNLNEAFGWSLPDTALPHTWSLAMEEQFYLVWPLVLTLILPRRPLVWMSALILAVVAHRVGLFALGQGSSRLYFGFDTHADGLLIGSALAMLSVNGIVFRLLVRAAPAAIPAALALLAAPRESAFTSTIGLTCAALVSAALIVMAMAGGPLHAVLSVGAIRYAGRISYGFYLWHLPVLTLGAHRFPRAPAYVFLAAAFAVAASSHHFVERPILKLKDRFAPRKRYAANLAGEAAPV